MSNWSPTYKAVCDICGETQEVSNYGDWACRKCLQGYTYEECHQITLTDAQLALLRNPPRWIPVGERPPEDAVPVLASDGKDVSVCLYGELKKRWHHVDDYFDWKPTHWMPLPAPPTDAK